MFSIVKYLSAAVLISLAFTSIHAQIFTNKALLPKEVSYFAIKDTTAGYPNDSIRFIVTGSLQERKPTMLFVEGSGNMAIIWQKDGKSYISALPAQTYANYKDKYHMVVISKPGVPLCTPSNRPTPWDMDSTYVSKVFWMCDMKDYYVPATATVLQYLQQQAYVDTSKLYLIGHSQGAHVVAKVAALYPKLAKKVAYMSSSPFGRSAENIISMYAATNKGQLSHEQLTTNLDSIYAELKGRKQWLIEDETSVKNQNYYISKSNNSFNTDPSVNYLSKIQIPLLIVYGTSDVKSADCCFLPLIMLGGNVPYSLKAYPNYDHAYFTLDKEGNREWATWHWDEVFKDVVNWMEEEQ